MTCGRCSRPFDENANSKCPYCGERARIIYRSSAVFISAGETEGVYRSVDEVPPQLKARLLTSTNGLNAATILIADRRGREELAKTIRRLPKPMQRRFQRLFGEDSGLFAQQPTGLTLPRLVALIIATLALVVVWLVAVHGYAP